MFKCEHQLTVHRNHLVKRHRKDLIHDPIKFTCAMQLHFDRITHCSQLSNFVRQVVGSTLEVRGGTSGDEESWMQVVKLRGQLRGEPEG